MMPVTLDKKAIEKSTLVVTAAFEDENGDSATPKSLKWSLVDQDGNIVNGREEVEISSPEAETDIVLTGNDLKLLRDVYEEVRWIVFEGTYNSTLGSDLSIKEQAKFYIINLKHVE